MQAMRALNRLQAAPTFQSRRTQALEAATLSVESSALNVERSAPKGAVFLSYARDDATAGN